MVPTDRDSFKEYCLRALGKPVIEINMADEQVDDRIDFALQTFYDYHYEGHDKVYYKYQLSPNNHSSSIYDLKIVNGGNNYTNGDLLTFTGNGSGATGSVITNASGTITNLVFTNGQDYANAPIIGVASSNGHNAIITAELGGWIPVPDNIIGITQIFDISASMGMGGLFNYKYQMVMSDLMMFNNFSVVPYYMVMQNIALIQEVLVGKQPLRFNRYQNRLYIDMDYHIVDTNSFVVAECYVIIDPAVYPEVWKNRWLQEYAICLIKKQWGFQLSKFTGMQMPGGLQFSGQKMFDDAVAEEKTLMYDLVHTYSAPTQIFVG